MEVYNLMFKQKPREVGYWHTCIYADNKEEAINKVKEILKKEKYYKCKLTKPIYSQRTIWKQEE